MLRLVFIWLSIKNTQSKEGAEAKYQIAQIYHDKGLNKKSEDEIGQWHDMVRLRDAIKDFSTSTPIHKQELSELLLTINKKNNLFIDSFEELIHPPINALKEKISTL